MANDDSLFRRLLRSSSLSAEDVESRFSRVRSYKSVYIQHCSERMSPVTGLFVCSTCGALFWAGQNVAKLCQQASTGLFKRHQPGVALTPSNLLSEILYAWARRPNLN